MIRPSAFQGRWSLLAPVDPVSVPAADPLLLNVAANARLGRGARVVSGIIVDAVAYLHAYRVFFDVGEPPLVCVLGTSTGTSAVGARQINTLAPGTLVWVIVDRALDYGVIVTAEPRAMTDPTQSISDFIHLSSACGLRVDNVHHSVSRTTGSGTIIDWSTGRPFDSLPIGEWGAIAETGVRCVMDSGQVTVGADEANCLSVFYATHLTRIAGINLQEFSGGHIREAICSGAEWVRYEGYSPYRWEQEGGLTPDARRVREVSAMESQISRPHYAPLEPIDDWMRSFHRFVTIQGYPVQGERRFVQTTPRTDGDTYSYKTEEHPIGLADFTTTMSGSVGVASANRVVIARRPKITVPRQRRSFGDARLDRGDTYRSAGIGENGAPHKTTAHTITTDEDHRLAQEIAARGDAVDHLFDFEGVAPALHHEQEWDCPDRTDDGGPVIDFGVLKEKHMLPAPEPIVIKIDHRYEDVSVSPLDQCIILWPNGQVTVKAGFGEVVEMAGGNIRIACPGDISMEAGRNIILKAGRDIHALARNSIDVSTTRRDIRIRAGGHFHVRAGNGRKLGSILLESVADRAYGYKDKLGEDVEAAGVHIKAPKSDVAIWSAGVVVRTGGGDCDAGSINIDAGDSDIVTRAGSMKRFVASSITDHFEGGSNIWSGDTNQISGDVGIGGQLTTLKGVSARGDIQAVGGYVYSELADQYNGLVGSIGQFSVASIEVTNGELSGRIGETNGRRVTDRQEVYDNGLMADGGATNDDTIQHARFTHRTVDQYGSGDFHVYEAEWQQRARSSGSGGLWTEVGVDDAPTLAKYPYPGAGVIDAETLLSQPPTFRDTPTTELINRGDNRSIFEVAEIKNPQRYVLLSNWRIVDAD